MVTLWGIFPVSAYDFQVDGIYYNFNGAEVTVTNGSYSGDVVIPESVTYEGKTYSVTSIGDDAFSYCSGLTSITLPESVTSIGDDAFWECNGLTTVTWNARACSIDRYLFGVDNNMITTFTFGDQVEQIPAGLCSGLKGLTTITLPESLTSIGGSAFSGCSGLTTITIPESVTSIESSVFSGCTGLTTITIPESVTSIGYSAFSGCSGLTSITLPESLTSIGEFAFAHCTGLTTITLPNSVTSIGEYAFQDCTGLTTITFPESLTSIDRYVFLRCSSLTTITIPESVTNIGTSAFQGCSGLASVVIGKSVTSIEENAFAGCNQLDLVTIHAVTPPEIWSNTFDDYGIPLYVPAGCKSKYQAAKYWRNFTNIQETGVTLYRVEAYSSDESMGSVMGGGEYAEGTVVTLAAIPASGYCFVQWSDGNTENPRQITATEDVSLMAEFSASGRLTVSSNDDAMGGVTAVLTAIPQAGYRFARWSDGNTENPRTVFVTESVNLVAEFVSSSAVETLTDQGMHAYVVDRTLHVENVEGDYRVYTTTGQLVYAGHAATVQLADAGVYVVRTSNRSQKVVVK